MNNSISLTTDALTTKTTVEFSRDFEEDEFILNGSEQFGKSKARVVKHLALIREIAEITLKAKVVSENNFPTAAGLASSASGFAALTVAACSASGLELDRKALSIISRRGSGSSCRSFFGGFVEWLKGDRNDNSYAIQLADENWFDIRDIIIVLDGPKRKMSTREAMKLSMQTSPFYNSRLAVVEKNLEKVRKAIRERDFKLLGETAEIDCLSMHSIALTSIPPQIFWTPGTVKLIHKVAELRAAGLAAYYTIDTGANMHILTLPEFERRVISVLKKLSEIISIIPSKPGKGTKLITDHLF